MEQMQSRVPEVSVIMPVYNAEKFLEESIGSVLAQTFRDFELICFNDASTDGSIDLLRRFAESDTRVKVIDSDHNVKQGGGRNRAIRAAQGRYVMFVDADDALCAEALERCVAASRQHNSEAVFFDYVRFAPSSAHEERVCQLGEDAAGLVGDDLRKRIVCRTTPVWTAMYARNLITDNNLFFPENVFYEDNAVAAAIQLAAKNPVKLDVALYRYRFDNYSVTRSSNNPHFFDRVETAVILLMHLKRLGLYGRFAEEIDFLFVNQYLVHTVYGAIYRFDRVQTHQIKRVVAGVGNYVPDFRRNRYYKAQPTKLKLKYELHAKMPHLIKLLSNANRALKLRK